MPVSRNPKPLTSCCPSCGERAITVRSDKVTDMLTRKILHCQNQACKAIFATNVTFSHWVMAPLPQHEQQPQEKQDNHHESH